MPPCAAMLCARRGESWKKKHLTLYPSSLIVAAADAPARPLPTMSTVYFRLFAGFTSFISKRCLSHFSAIGPEGTLASRDLIARPPRTRRLVSRRSRARSGLRARRPDCVGVGVGTEDLCPGSGHCSKHRDRDED